MFYFRFTSPLCWLAAIVLFFLPWLDLRCVENGKERTFATLSGAEVASGAVRFCVAEPSEHFTWRQLRELAACFILIAYGLGLFAALVPFCMLRPSLRRARIGIKIACILTCLLLVACCMLFDGGPFFSSSTTPSGDPFSDPDIESLLTMSLTRWYYGSYIANVLAVLTFALEWWWMRKIEKLAKEKEAVSP